MNLHERQHHDQTGGAGPAPVPPPSGHLGELHRAGDDLLAAGDEAIRRALSGDSEAFLRANRQKGGQ
ncbi:MAG: hypothetical protein ACT4PM_01985 [Gemmatimonadales bacterium]